MYILLVGHCVLSQDGGYVLWPCPDGAPGEVGVAVLVSVPFTGCFFLLVGGMMAKCPPQTQECLFLLCFGLTDVQLIGGKGTAIPQTHESQREKVRYLPGPKGRREAIQNLILNQ